MFYEMSIEKLNCQVDQWQPSTPPLIWKWLPFAGVTVEAIRDFKIQRRWQQRERQKKKNNPFYRQNNNFVRASHLFEHFFARFCTTTTWTCLILRFMEYVLGYGP